MSTAANQITDELCDRVEENEESDSKIAEQDPKVWRPRQRRQAFANEQDRDGRQDYRREGNHRVSRIGDLGAA